MQLTLFIAAAILYAVCALLPSRQGSAISAVTAVAWAVHGLALWPDSGAEPDWHRPRSASFPSAALSPDDAHPHPTQQATTRR